MTCCLFCYGGEASGIVPTQTISIGGNMELQQFEKEIIKALREYYGDEIKIESHTVYKNNGLQLVGICVLPEGQNIAPTVYINQYYARYQKGAAFGSIVEEIISFLEKNKLTENLNVDFFLDYEQVKKRLVFRLINRQKNEKLLQEVPYQEWEDLAVVCHCLMMNDLIGTGSILIHKQHLKVWNISEETLFEDAKKNSIRMEPFRMYPMSEMIRMVMRKTIQENIEEICEEYPQDKEKLMERTLETMANDLEENQVPMYVLTNTGRYYGAACLVYPNLLEQIGNQIQEDFYIIPSSVHEVILISKNVEMEESYLNKVIQEVNDTQVEPDEWLSDHAYFYRREDKCICSVV